MNKSFFVRSLCAFTLILSLSFEGAAATTCKAGKYLKDGKCVTCPDGQISDEGAYTSCTTCPAGKYCTKGIKNNCPAGSYCPANSSAPTACTGNQYTSVANQKTYKVCDGKNQIVRTDRKGCQNCPNGQEPNAEHTACEAKCDPGQYYSGGKCKDCDAGYYCADGKNRTACPAGTYNSNTKSTSAAACVACTGNQYTSVANQKTYKVCDGKNQIVKADYKGCQNCPNGQEPNAEHTACVAKCDAGQYYSGGKCKDCDAGYYCADGLKREKCPEGQKTAPDGKSCIVDCEPGEYLNASKRCEECPAGSYCVNGIKKTCPDGQYTDRDGQSSCTICEEGTYESGHNSCVACPAGKYCTKGIKNNCPAGSYCPANSSAPTACTGNQYTSIANQKTYKVCDGKNQIVKADYKGCQNCPNGQEPNAEHTACVACTGGLYNGVCGKCKANYPSKLAYACTSAENPICNEITGVCEAKEKCTANYGAKTPGACSEDKPMCNQNTGVCQVCPVGSKYEDDKCIELQPITECQEYDDRMVVVNKSDLTPCRNGNGYCKDGGCIPLIDTGLCQEYNNQMIVVNKPDFTECGVGYCKQGVCTQCGENQKYNSQTKACECQGNFVLQNGKCVSLGAAIGPCPQNAICQNGEIIKCQENFVLQNGECVSFSLGAALAQCPRNAICQNGEIVKCQEGYKMEGSKCVLITVEKPSDLHVDKTICGAGERLVDNSCLPCLAGYYCPAGEKPKACPVGTYNPNKGQDSSKACKPCAYALRSGMSSCRTSTIRR